MEKVTDTEDIKLLPLRQDLQLYPAQRTRDGAREWSLLDPLRQNFYRIGWLEFALLSQWHRTGTAAELIERVRAEQGLEATLEDVQALQKFLLSHQLLQVEDSQYTSHLLGMHRKSQRSWWQKVLHNYLFFRIPLVHPDAFLERTLPQVQKLLSPFLVRLWWLITLAGVIMVSRQWESFQHTFLYFFTWQGFVAYAAALVMVKIAHELGHAYTAKHYGLKVPTMGVAFLVMWPVLYTDTTDAWKLPSRKARLHIDAAGMWTELAIAGLATFLWVFFPDGMLRSAVFLLATVTWVMTLLVNLNPFMRFDGYYLMSDLLDVPNLQDRAFAFGRWWLRRFLLGLDLMPPEEMSAARRNTLILYAFGTWIYRAGLFLGIALLVYHFFFKTLGLFLMLVEVGWFLARPVWNELSTWYRLREQLSFNRASRRSLFLLVLLLLLLVVPWQNGVSYTALLRPADYARIYSPEAARVRIVHVSQNDQVIQGQLLVELVSPELEFNITSEAVRVRALQWQLQRHQSVASLREYGDVAREQLQQSLARLHRYEGKHDSLQVRAPFDGIVKQLEPNMHEGRWVYPRLPLLYLSGNNGLVVETFIREQDIGVVEQGARSNFYPSTSSYPVIPLQVIAVDRASSRYIESPWFTSEYGGDVPVTRDSKQRARSQEAVYRVLLAPSVDTPEPSSLLRGTVRIEGDAHSLIVRVWRAAAAVLIRESGF
jgi:putative peptide zinc metalloprotease protein